MRSYVDDMQLLTHPPHSSLCNWGTSLGSTVTASRKNILRCYVDHDEHSRFDNEGPQLQPAGKIPALQTLAGWVLGWVELFVNNSNAFNSSFMGGVGMGRFHG